VQTTLTRLRAGSKAAAKWESHVVYQPNLALANGTSSRPTSWAVEPLIGAPSSILLSVVTLYRT
jgi:hypothetical protein